MWLVLNRYLESDGIRLRLSLYICATIAKDTQKEIGKFLVDVAKLVFGGGILATIIKSDRIDEIYIIIIGFTIIPLLIIVGFYFINKSNT